MSNMQEISAAQAIAQVIAQTGAVDYIDIVHAVRDRFRLNVTTAQVEQVYHDLANETKPGDKTRPSVPLTSQIPDPTVSEPGNPSDQPELTLPMQPVPTQPRDLLTDDLGHALQFVKSVGGLANAKRVLGELEAILTGNN